MRLEDHYRQRLARAGHAPDSHQLAALEALQALGDRLQAAQPSAWRRWMGKRAAPPKGVYLWGGVGRGKTWLMDLFFELAPEPRRQRWHFHRFMQQVHARLAGLRERDPLQRVAREMAREARLLCLDEFHVSDIGDAMILAGLLRALFAQGVVLVTTANVPPRELYRDGIQRASFLPAIDLLEQHLEVVELGGERDFRREILAGAAVYHCPADAAADAAMASEFERIAGEAVLDGPLEINGRPMPCRRRAEGVVWFDFEALCGPPRSQHDYIELARTHHTVFLSGVPLLGASRDDRTRRFIFLIDEFYDRRVKLVMSAAARPERLYQGSPWIQLVSATRSRAGE